jgi:hypothetical protein
MTINELLNVLYTVPFNKLTDGIIYCRINNFVDVVSTLGRVDIDFMRGNTCIGFIRVYGDNTINPALPEILQTNPRRKEYLEAIEKVITYLEILGFRNEH